MIGGAEGFCMGTEFSRRPGLNIKEGGAGHVFDSGGSAPYHARAMRNPLLDRSTPAELADAGQVVEVEEELARFAQLAQVVAADLASLDAGDVPRKWRQEPVAIRLAFGWADPGRRYPLLEGHVAARVPAVCQRCLGPMELDLDVDLKLVLMRAGEAAPAAEDLEAWEIEEATIRPLDIVEEALIMAMPLSAMHGAGEACKSPADTALAATADSIRPFADLRSMLASGRNGGEGSDDSTK